MAGKSNVDIFLNRVSERKCEDGHDIPNGKSFCPDCGKPIKAVSLKLEQRISEIEGVLVELLDASPSKKSSKLFKKLGNALKWLVTSSNSKPQTAK